MATIKQVTAYQILDSRGDPTIEVALFLSDGTVSFSSAPSGASKGTYEAAELRDGDPARYGGLGVENAVRNVNEIIAPKLLGIEAGEQQKIDKLMIEIDGSPNKSRIGANAIISVSQAVAKAGALSSGVPLFSYIRGFTQGGDSKKMPIPIFNILEGGRHADNTLDFQEFLVIPASSKTFSEGLFIGGSIFHSLKKVLKERNLSTLNADEGGFAPLLPTNKDAFANIKEAIEKAGFAFSFDVFLGADVAANSFSEDKLYKLREKAMPLKTPELIEYHRNLLTEFSLTYFEDPLGEDDWDGWKKIHAELGDKTLLVGDDLITSNPYRLQLAIDNNVCGGIVVKPNQIGTVTEAIAVAEIARFKNIKIIVSHRSGETLDNFVSDFAIGIGADYVKFGAPSRERVAKYNRLSAIEKELNA